MFSFDLNKFKTLLRFDGVDTSTYSDDELSILLESKVDELESILGVPLHPKERSDTMLHYHGHVYELNFYPVTQVHKISLNGECIPLKFYTVNNDTGIIYFKKRIHGHLKVQYISSVLPDDYKLIITPLLKDMLAYSISYGKWNNSIGGLGFLASSLHEGDVSISHGSASSNANQPDYGYNNSINNRINDLKNKYARNCRIKWI